MQSTSLPVVVLHFVMAVLTKIELLTKLAKLLKTLRGLEVSEKAVDMLEPPAKHSKNLHTVTPLALPATPALSKIDLGEPVITMPNGVLGTWGRSYEGGVR